MHESPSTTQLLHAVISFLNDVATPQLTGHAQFHARVSANALALIARELAQHETADAQARRIYGALLNIPQSDATDLATLEACLCNAITSGHMDHTTPNLLAGLRDVATAQLAVDQPAYSGLKA